MTRILTEEEKNYIQRIEDLLNGKNAELKKIGKEVCTGWFSKLQDLLFIDESQFLALSYQDDPLLKELYDYLLDNKLKELTQFVLSWYLLRNIHEAIRFISFVNPLKNIEENIRFTDFVGPTYLASSTPLINCLLTDNATLPICFDNRINESLASLAQVTWDSLGHFINTIYFKAPKEFGLIRQELTSVINNLPMSINSLGLMFDERISIHIQMDELVGFIKDLPQHISSLDLANFLVFESIDKEKSIKLAAALTKIASLSLNTDTVTPFILKILPENLKSLTLHCNNTISEIFNRFIEDIPDSINKLTIIAHNVLDKENLTNTIVNKLPLQVNELELHVDDDLSDEQMAKIKKKMLLNRRYHAINKEHGGLKDLVCLFMWNKMGAHCVKEKVQIHGETEFVEQSKLHFKVNNVDHSEIIPMDLSKCFDEETLLGLRRGSLREK